MDKNEKFYEDIKSVVSQIFSEKEEAEKVKQTEQALQKSADSIEELTTALETSNEEVTDLQEKLTAAEEKVKELEEGLEAAQKEAETANEKVAETEKALEEIMKDRAAELRMAELAKDGVKRTDSESQQAKVREMTDEEFAAYKEELISLRAAIVDELKTAQAEEEEASEEDNEEEASNEEDEENASDEDEEKASEDDEDQVTEPANVDPGSAISAAMNFEVIPSKDLLERYRRLGQAMASSMKKNK